MARKSKGQGQSLSGSPSGRFTNFSPKTIQGNRAPTTADTGYEIGQLWADQNGTTIYGLSAVSAGSATWNLLGPGASDVDTLTGDGGGAISPAGGNITLAGGTNITSAGAGSTITFNLDAAITLATSVTSALYTAAAGTDLLITVPAGQDMVMKMGDAAGANKISFTDSADSEVANMDSDGQLNLVVGDLIVVRSAASVEVLCDVTNSDNTMADSDAFFEAAVGGTSSGNPGIRFQISGGQNYAIGIDNAAAADDLLIGGDNDIGTDPLLRIEEAGDVTVEKGNLIMGAVATQLQMNGGAVTDFIGQATLVAGTVTVANTNIAAGDRIFCTRSALNASPALGDFITTIVAATSFTVASYDAVGVLENTDVSAFDYFIVRQN